MKSGTMKKTMKAEMQNRTQYASETEKLLEELVAEDPRIMESLKRARNGDRGSSGIAEAALKIVREGLRK